MSTRQIKQDWPSGEIAQVMHAAAEAGGAVIRDYYLYKLPEIKDKVDRTLVTTADYESEKAILSIIRQKFPDHYIDSEEAGKQVGNNSTYRWLVDPLDGTENFVSSIPYISLSIAFCIGSVPKAGIIFNPLTMETYFALAGEGATKNGQPIALSKTSQLDKSRVAFIPDMTTKRLADTTRVRNDLLVCTRRVLDTWAPALDWCLLASGKIDGLIAISANEISANAGTLMVQEAGGRITDFRGHTELGACILATNGTNLHELLLDVVAADNQPRTTKA